MRNRKALLIIDMQKGSFTPKTPRFDTKGVVARINGLTRLFRQLDFPVIFIQHDGNGTGEFEKNTEEWELLDELEIGPTDILVDKIANDVFYKSELQSRLKELKTRQLYITGCATDFCVESTIQSALTKDFDLTVVQDGHTTGERPHLSAEKVIEHYNWVWQNMIPINGKIAVKNFRDIKHEISVQDIISFENMGVKEHYDKHLANFYSWMVGELEPKSIEFKDFLLRNNIIPKGTKVALDLGAGNGIQSIALKELGFEVIAVDFNEQLLNELKSNPKAKGINIEIADMRNVRRFENLRPELIICCGDTITHLENKKEIGELINDSIDILTENGNLVLTFRDYSNELSDRQRFIPVKSSSDRILTCILEYEQEKVKVTDLLHEKTNGEWKQKVSSYEKVRVSPEEIIGMIETNGMKINFNETINRLHAITAGKTA